MPVPPPTAPSFGNPSGIVEGRQDVLLLHMEAVDVVQPTVIRLGDHREPPRLQHVALADLPLDDRIADHPHSVGVRDGHRPLEVPLSCTQVVPVISPLPLSVNQEAKTGS
jgi:hypothetical protein